eukprot:gene9352-10334_t
MKELEEKILKKDEENENTERTLRQHVNVLSENLENESRGRNEQARHGKRLEELVKDLEGQVDRLNAANVDLTRVNKKTTQEMKELEVKYDDEKINHDGTIADLQRSDKKMKEVVKQSNETKSQLEQLQFILYIHL